MRLRRQDLAASFSDASTSMSMKATFAPWAAKAVTIAAPIPEPPPVTSTTRSFRLG